MPEYTLEEMLDRFYDNNIKGKSKTVLSKPEVKLLNRKTYVLNFAKICQQLNRDQNMVLKYFTKEANCATSVSEDGKLIMSNILRNPYVENTLTKFITDHVQCQMCKSQNTSLIKKDRLTYLVCSNCHAEKSVDAVI